MIATTWMVVWVVIDAVCWAATISYQDVIGDTHLIVLGCTPTTILKLSIASWSMRACSGKAMVNFAGLQMLLWLVRRLLSWVLRLEEFGWGSWVLLKLRCYHLSVLAHHIGWLLWNVGDIQLVCGHCCSSWLFILNVDILFKLISLCNGNSLSLGLVILWM